jgi:hypothetical protein
VNETVKTNRKRLADVPKVATARPVISAICAELISETRASEAAYPAPEKQTKAHHFNGEIVLQRREEIAPRTTRSTAPTACVVENIAVEYVILVLSAY